MGKEFILSPLIWKLAQIVTVMICIIHCQAVR